MSRHLPAGVTVLLCLAVSACTHAHAFNVAAARTHVDHLAGEIGPRPLGSDANAIARAYLIDQLRGAGFTVRIQEAEGRNARFGTTGRVRNVIAFRDGHRQEAIGIVAHYDSVAQAPGAADDGIGTAVALEAARALGTAPRTWSLLVLLTDGEEAGLLGASAAVHDPELMQRLRTYVNVEAMGPEPPGVLFESGPDNPWLIDAWARSAPHPDGASYFQEIYRHLPNDTDFTEFRRAGVPGLNMAAVGNIYVYHSPRDSADRIDDRVLAALGENVVSWVDALEGEDITRREAGDAVFFDVASEAVSARATAWRFVDLLAVSAAGLGWAWLTITTWRRLRVEQVLKAYAWSVIALAIAAGTSIAVVWLLREVREVYHPWYAHPLRTCALISISAAMSEWLLIRLAAHLPQRWRVARDPVLVWMPTLAAWTIAAALLAHRAPLAAYLWTLPAGVAGLSIGATARSRRGMGLASALVALFAAVLWIPDGRQLVSFAVPMAGMFPVILPVAMLPVLLFVPAMMVVPPVIATIVAAPIERPRFATRFLVAATVFSFAWAYVADAYTVDRPERRSARYVADVQQHTARWELGSREPGSGVDRGGPARWRLAARDTTRDDEPTLNAPFVHVADVSMESPPGSAVRRVTEEPDGMLDLEVEVRVTQADVWAVLQLPPGIVPTEANYPGRESNRRWTATYVSVPPEGVRFRLQLPGRARGQLDDLRVTFRTAVPGATAPGLGPPWLPEGRITWAAQALYRMPVLEE